MPRYVLFLFVTFFLCLSVSVVAAAPPDAGSLINQDRQPGTSLPDRLPTAEEKGVERPVLAETGTRVMVKGFRFSGLDELATEAELQELVSGSIGKELDFAALQELATRVTNYLRDKKGYLLAKAYLPKQDVTEGIIEIAILAGRIEGKVKVNIKQPSRIKLLLLEGIADRSVPENSPARMEQIERAVLLIKDLPGIDAQASLEPGTDSGTTRMTIEATEGPLLSGAVIGDNFGDRYTGAWRATGLVAVNDPFGMGDQLQLSVTGAKDLTLGRISYDLPWGSTGFKSSFFFSALSYEIGKELSVLNAEGDASTLGVNLSYPLLRTRKASLWGKVGFEYQSLTDKANGQTMNDRDLSVGNASLSGIFYDNFGGGGLTSTSLTLYQGSLDISDEGSAKTVDDAGPRANGSFSRGTYSLARLQRLTSELSLFAAVRGQFAANNLDSSQKFILGGPTGVRAYPVSEGSGDEGHLLTAELRYDVPTKLAGNTIQLVGFYDGGWVKLHHDTWAGSVTNSTASNDYWLSGAGIGLNVGKAGRYSMRVSYAHTIGDNDGRDLNGKDVDNKSNDDRFWLQAMVWF